MAKWTTETNGTKNNKNNHPEGQKQTTRRTTGVTMARRTTGVTMARRTATTKRTNGPRNGENNDWNID